MKCFFCGVGNLIWGCDYSFEDFMLDGDGIVSVHTCSECGATWEGYLPLEDEENLSKASQKIVKTRHDLEEEEAL